MCVVSRLVSFFWSSDLTDNCCARMLSYDFITAVILLQDEESAVPVDVSLCIEAQTCGEWVRERKG